MHAPQPFIAGHIEDAPAWAALLEYFYERAGLPLPLPARLKGPDMPQPYRDLLVHSKDMTPTLEAFYGQPLGLSVLSSEMEGVSTYIREVVLTSGARPVEYGAIRIFLDHFPARARRLILNEATPLGRILQQEGIPHFGWPQAFFEVEADPHMREKLCIAEACQLYGRRNVLLNGARRLLAEVVEILAPV